MMGRVTTCLGGVCLLGLIITITILVDLWSVVDYDSDRSARLNVLNDPDPDPYTAFGHHRDTRAARCPPLQLSNGRIKLKNKRTIAYFKCKKRFQLIGQKISTCLSGKWSNQPPVCAKSGCDPLTLAPPMRHRYVYQGAVAQFMCPYGYNRHGPLSVFCDGKNWNQPPPLCNKIPTTTTTTVVTTTTETEPTSSHTTGNLATTDRSTRIPEKTSTMITERQDSTPELTTPTSHPSVSTRATTAQPAETTSNPAETTSNQAETTSNPAETTSNPAETTSNPAETTSNPAETTSKPAETTAKPTKTTTKLVKRTFTEAKPLVTSAHPMSQSSEFGTSGRVTLHTPHLKSLQPDVDERSSNDPWVERTTKSPTSDYINGLPEIVTEESVQRPGDSEIISTREDPDVSVLRTSSTDISGPTNISDISDTLESATQGFEVSAITDNDSRSTSQAETFGRTYTGPSVTNEGILHHGTNDDLRGSTDALQTPGFSSRHKMGGYVSESRTSLREETNYVYTRGYHKYVPVYEGSSPFDTGELPWNPSTTPTFPKSANVATLHSSAPIHPSTSIKDVGMPPKQTSNSHKSTLKKTFSNYFRTRQLTVTPDTRAAHSSQHSRRDGLFVGLVIAAVIVCAAILVLGAWAARWLYTHRSISYTLSKREDCDEYISVPYTEATDTKCTKESDM